MAISNDKYARTRTPYVLSGTSECTGQDVKRVPIVQDHLNELEKELNLLGELVAKLESRLEPILIRNSTGEPPEKERVKEIPVPLADRISSLAEQVCRIRQNVEWITSRVEV